MNNNDKALSDKSLEKVGGGTEIVDVAKQESTHMNGDMLDPFSIPINDTEKIEKYWGSVGNYKNAIESNPYFYGYDNGGVPTWSSAYLNGEAPTL